MRKNTVIIAIVVCAISLVACMPDEQPVAPHAPGENEHAFVTMGGEYEWRVYFDLETNSEVFITEVDGWDLAFDCAADGYEIRLNTGKIMAVAHTGTSDFESVTSKKEAVWQYDIPNGSGDSTAFGKWADVAVEPLNSYQWVYIVDRGYNVDADHLGFIKVQFLSFTRESYRVRYANLDGSEDNVVEVNKSDLYNYIGLSFDTGNEIQIEPPTNEWDLVFTKYTELFRIPELLAYSVTGALSNRNGVLVALDTLQSFAEIGFDDISTYTFSSDWNAIGFDWKSFSLQDELFSIVPNRTYLIKDIQGFYYKLQFVGFYNKARVKGHPQFEFQRL